MRIACVQFAPVHKNIEKNLETIERLLRSSEPADLFVLPELALSGYAFTSSDEAKTYATNGTHKAIVRLKELARDLRAAITIGIIEDENDKLYNAAYLISKDGEISLRYRKVHLFYYEKVVFTPGDLGFPVATIAITSGENAVIGVQICYDWRFPESTRSLAVAGAQIIAMPSNIVTTTGMLINTLQTRAFENKVIIAFADRIGTEILPIDEPHELTFRGESCIVNFTGEILQIAATNETIISYDVEQKHALKKAFNKFNDIIADRRPSEYR